MELEKVMSILRKAGCSPAPAVDPKTGQQSTNILQATCPACHDTGRTLYALYDENRGLVDFHCRSPLACSHEIICDTLKIDPVELVPYDVARVQSALISSFKPLAEFEERAAEWVIKGWAPRGQIVTLAADGGVGKTSLVCNLAAAVSNAVPSVLDPPGAVRQPERVLLMNAEDSVREQLKRRMREAGANMELVMSPDFVNGETDILHQVKFGTKELETAIRVISPAICIFDPIQSFLPPKVNMGSRNEMRDCLAQLIGLGENLGTTFVLVCHSNKRKGAYGRDRISDSADIWDISRSVIMMGYTEEEGVRYISNEKNSYSKLQETVLFKINEKGQVEKCGTTCKRDRDYIMQDYEQRAEKRSAPQRDDCKQFIITALQESGGKLSVKELDEQAQALGYSKRTLTRAKQEMKDAGEIELTSEGSGRDNSKAWYITRTEVFTDVTDTEWEQAPFDELTS